MTGLWPFRSSMRLPRRRLALEPPGGRLFGLALAALGIGLLTVATAPMLAGAQTAAVIPHDPGVRVGTPGAGGPINGLTTNQQAFFDDGLNRFNEIDSVSGTATGEGGVGLGPRFNMNSCAGCHAQPAVGGTSPSTNPEVAVAHDTSAGCTATTCNPEDLSFPFLSGTLAQPFISSTGPVREARFVRNPDGSPDGGVHDLFTIAGRSDAPQGCSLAQPDFVGANNSGNLVARIPTPVFGAGLIEAIQDSTIIGNQLANSQAKQAASIHGHPNREGNAGTITRFGWKAQNKSPEIFAGEAYLVEQGVTNELFPNERGEPGERPSIDGTERVEPQASCLSNGIPEDATNFGAINDATPKAAATGALSDVVGFSLFMEFLAPPTPACNLNPTQLSAVSSNCAGVNQGFSDFNQIGCGLCHTPSLQTGKSSVAALSNQKANLFSDLLVHHMGDKLADNVAQGNAGADEFRTAPLWGVGQRIFFLHDGRTKDLLEAIAQHVGAGSEANAVIARFNNLSATDQQDILNFLRIL